jgi:CRISPR/Cas system-associated exonuclease Cas4 (RecB family)
MSEFTWSFSSLKEYTNCPKKYYEMRVLKTYTVEPTPQMLYGTEVHEALELYVRDNKPLAKNYLRFKKMVDALIAIPGTKYPEHEMALDEKLQPCEFGSDKRWVRGIVDLLIVDGENAFIIDYKTGSNRYPDTKQLRLMALMTYAHFPEVNNIKAGLLFVMKNSFVQESYTRNTIYQSWKKFEQPLERLSLSYRDNVWMPNPTPLCGWCPIETCEFHKPRK